MAIGEYYSVPEIIDPMTASEAAFESCIKERCSMEKSKWAGEQLVDLAERRPEELPPCFLAFQAEALSPREGWTTKHGKWEPKDLFASFMSVVLRRRDEALGSADPKGSASSLLRRIGSVERLVMKSTMVFRTNDGKKTDLAMTLYNVINTRNSACFLEEDIALCRVFRLTKKKSKGVVHSEPLRSPFGVASDPFECLSNVEIPDFNSDFDFSDFDITNLDPSDFEIPESLHYGDEDNGVADGLPSIDSSGGTKKRPRSNTKGSEVWHSFIKIYTKDPEVVYAACIHCGRMMKLKGGSKCGTKSLSRHLETCACKHGSSVASLH